MFGESSSFKKLLAAGPMLQLYKKLEDLPFTVVVDNQIKEMKLSEFKTKILVLVFYPADFTTVCPTEILKLSEMYERFRSVDAQVIFISGDSPYCHKAWMGKPVEEGGIGNVKWPMLSDKQFKLSRQFGMFNEETMTVLRGTVILGSDRTVKAISATHDSIGRSSCEILRLVEAIIFNEEYGDMCPVDFSLKK